MFRAELAATSKALIQRSRRHARPEVATAVSSATLLRARYVKRCERTLRRKLIVNLHSLSQGVPPASLAEFTLSGGGLDWYDVSLVDGFNIPMSIETDKGCVSSVCSNNITTSCGSKDSTSQPFANYNHPFRPEPTRISRRRLLKCM